MNTIISLFDAKLLLIAYLVLMNLIALIAFGADKHKAEKHVFRTPESVLLTLAVIGGAAGALAGMFLLPPFCTSRPPRSCSFEQVLFHTENWTVQIHVLWYTFVKKRELTVTGRVHDRFTDRKHRIIYVEAAPLGVLRFIFA